MFQFRDLASQVKGLLAETSPKTVIINGDLKHEFDIISRQEWREVLMFLDLPSGFDVKLVRGNHDTILGPIAGKKNVEIVDHLLLGTTYFTHGHKKQELGEISESSPKSSQKILEIIEKHPEATIKEIAKMLGISDRAVKKNLAKLKEKGLLKRIGPDKGGHWEVLR